MLLTWLPGRAQELLMAQQGTVTFFSVAPLENIQATSRKITGTIHNISKKINFNIPINSFEFNNSLMQEHFNDKFMESHRYPTAEFSGEIVSGNNYLEAGTHEVTVKGNLQVHGIERERIIKGTIINKDGKLKLKSNFNIKLKDHNIKVPDLVYEKVAEVIDVSLMLDLAPMPDANAKSKSGKKLKNTISKAEY